MQVTVHANQVPISPRKLRFATHPLRGLTVARAIAAMSASPRQTLGPIIKLLQASVSAARDRSPAATANDLRVTELFVNEGGRVYRGRRRSKGRVSRFAKASAHITLSVTVPSAPAPAAAKPAKAKSTAPAAKPTSAPAAKSE